MLPATSKGTTAPLALPVWVVPPCLARGLRVSGGRNGARGHEAVGTSGAIGRAARKREATSARTYFSFRTCARRVAAEAVGLHDVGRSAWRRLAPSARAARALKRPQLARARRKWLRTYLLSKFRAQRSRARRVCLSCVPARGGGEATRRW